MERLNAKQARQIMESLGEGLHDELTRHGDVQGAGLRQEADGEVVVVVSYQIGTMKTVPLSYGGYRIVAQERPRATF